MMHRDKMEVCGRSCGARTAATDDVSGGLPSLRVRMVHNAGLCSGTLEMGVTQHERHCVLSVLPDL